MAEFIAGVKDKYPDALLKGRISVEGNVIACLMKDMLLLDDSKLKPDNFITEDGKFYFGLLQHLRKKGFYSLDEVTILSNCSSEVIEKYNEKGGWNSIQHLQDVINESNFDTYLDIFYRDNILLNMHVDGFNLLSPILINNKKVIPLSLLRKMTAEEVCDWYSARIAGYDCGQSSVILEEVDLDIDDDFITSCELGEENGVSFGSLGTDIDGEDINGLSFLSNQINGMPEGGFSMLAAYSGVGKSSLWTTIILGLLEMNRKVLIISNEQKSKIFKANFMCILLARYFKYFKLTKKKLLSGDISNEDREMINNVQNLWREKYKGNIKFISMSDANMTVVKKKIREYVLREGYDTVLYDTMKLDFSDTDNNKKEYLSLIEDSREFDTIAKKYNIIMLASLQLSLATLGTLWLDASCLSGAKGIKEVLENLFLMRCVMPEELDPKSKYYLHPFRLKKVGDKWIEEEYQIDTSATWRLLFVNKTRSGQTSDDNGCAYMLKFNGSFCSFKETCQCRPRHGHL